MRGFLFEMKGLGSLRWVSNRVQTKATFRMVDRKSLKEGMNKGLRGGSIVFEDDWIVGINKYSGIPVQEGTFHSFEDSLDFELYEKGWKLVHRLDMDTSGILIAAKNDEAARRMAELFRMNSSSNRQVTKEYLALLLGIPKKRSGTIELPVRGSSAISQYSVISEGKDISLLRMSPITGRKHQLRIHSRYGLGYGIVGDSKYSTITPLSLKLERERMKLCLHSASLSFVHPFTQESVEIKAPLPTYMEKTCNRFGIVYSPSKQKHAQSEEISVMKGKDTKQRKTGKKSVQTPKTLFTSETTKTPSEKVLSSRETLNAEKRVEIVSLGYGRMNTGIKKRIVRSKELNK